MSNVNGGGDAHRRARHTMLLVEEYQASLGFRAIRIAQHAPEGGRAVDESEDVNGGLSTVVSAIVDAATSVFTRLWALRHPTEPPDKLNGTHRVVVGGRRKDGFHPLGDWVALAGSEDLGCKAREEEREVEREARHPILLRLAETFHRPRINLVERGSARCASIQLKMEILGQDGVIHVTLEVLDLQAAELPFGLVGGASDALDGLSALPLEVDDRALEATILDLLESGAFAEERPRSDSGDARVVARLVGEEVDLAAEDGVDERSDETALLVLVRASVAQERRDLGESDAEGVPRGAVTPDRGDNGLAGFGDGDLGEAPGEIMGGDAVFRGDWEGIDNAVVVAFSKGA